MITESIQWHKECRANTAIYLNRKFEELKRLRDEVGRLEDDLWAYDLQIAQAEKEGRASFNRDTFAKKLLAKSIKSQ